MVLEKTLERVPWPARRSNQSIVKEISPEYSLERLMLKLQSFGHLMRRTDSVEKTLMLGKIEAGGEKGLRGSGAGTLGVPLGGTRRVGGLLGQPSISHDVLYTEVK